jgi:DNA-binding protein H-NS
MGTTLERAAQDIRERSEQVRRELAERERAYRVETQQLRDELGRQDEALRAMGTNADAVEPSRPVVRSRRGPRGQNRAKVLAVEPIAIGRRACGRAEGAALSP